jgi:phosphoribosylamine---glycine ligase
MRILCVDRDAGNGQLSFIMRALDASHEVKWAFSKPTDWNAQPIGKGIADIVHDWRGWMRWADLVVLGDNTRYLAEIDVWRRDRGTRVIGATVESSRWELDRTFGQQVFKKAGIPVPPFREFSNYDEAIRYVEKEGRCFVSKPCGDEENKALSYVPDSPADLIYMLQRWKRAQKHKDSFILQEKVKGTEFAVGGWFGPAGFNAGWHENFEHKSLFVGNLGPNTGEMGTALRITAKSKLADKVLKPIANALEKTGHTGYVDVNCIVDEDGEPWPLEFTMRFGYPTWPIQQHLVVGDPVEWLFDLAEGRDAKPFAHNVTAIGVIMAMGDFPHSHMTKKDVVGIPLYGARAGVLDRVSFCEVMRGTAPHQVGGAIINKPCFVTAGDYVLVAVGTDATVQGARDRAYRTLGRLKPPSSPFWRTDIGQRLRHALPVLQEQGFALGWTYADAQAG